MSTQNAGAPRGLEFQESREGVRSASLIRTSVPEGAGEDFLREQRSSRRRLRDRSIFDPKVVPATESVDGPQSPEDVSPPPLIPVETPKTLRTNRSTSRRRLWRRSGADGSMKPA